MRPFYLSTKKNRGQTLVEVLVTVVILAVGVIALIRFQNYLSYDSSLTQQTADATTLAIKQIETLRDYQVLTTTTGYSAYSDIASGSQSTAVANTTYSISWTVTTQTNPDYKNIDVTVSWTDRRSGAQSVRYISRISNADPSKSATVM